jgi:hypothetical protein
MKVFFRKNVFLQYIESILSKRKIQAKPLFEKELNFGKILFQHKVEQDFRQQFFLQHLKLKLANKTTMTKYDKSIFGTITFVATFF